MKNVMFAIIGIAIAAVCFVIGNLMAPEPSEKTMLIIDKNDAEVVELWSGIETEEGEALVSKEYLEELAYNSLKNEF